MRLRRGHSFRGCRKSPWAKERSLRARYNAAMAEFKRLPGEGEATAAPVDWRRLAVEAAGYVFLAWAALVAINVYAFNDPAARSAAGGELSHLPQILTHLPHNVALFFALIFALAAGIAPGDAVLRLFRLPYRDAFDRIAFGTVAGLARADRSSHICSRPCSCCAGRSRRCC